MTGAGTLLTEFQVEVARVFFGLTSSEGFLLAGGAALLAHHLTARPTQDLDFFTRPGAGDIRRTGEEFLAAAQNLGWSVEVVHDGGSFCRLLVRGSEDLLVDLALDSPPGRPPTATIIGPTFAPDELAGRKVLALFDRAAARDFVDVYALSRTYTRQTLLILAAEVDAGFDLTVFAGMLAHLPQYRDVDLQLGDADVPAIRDFFQQWAAELRTARS